MSSGIGAWLCEDTKAGMVFNKVNEAYLCYTKYAEHNGFAVAIRTSKKGRDCKACFNIGLCPNGRWILNRFVLEHNQEMNPGKSRFYKCHRVLNEHVKKIIELNDKAGIRMNKIYH